MPPYGLISLTDRVNLPEELAARGYGEDVLYDYDPAFGELRTTQRYQPAPFTGARPFQALYDLSPVIGSLYGTNLGFDANFYNPSFGGVSGYRDTGGIMGIDVAPTSLGFDTSYGVANEEDEEQVESLVEEEPSGIQKLIQTALRFAVPGLSFLQNIAGGGQPYQQFSPGTTIRNGIVSVAGVNTPYSAFGGDFYNPNTGLNRFDRAAERFKKTGSMLDLFGSSRTGKEFFEKRREIEAQKQKALEDAAKAKRQFKQDTGGGGGGNSGTTSGPSSGTGRGATSATSSSLGGLGFSDKRLKENIELIGKSLSNINIYKFNYKNNPTTYQGVMADEVSWASVKHPNGYMMVDYNKIDVEFKKI